LQDGELAQLRDATNYNYAFGSKGFAETMAYTLGRQVARMSSTKRPASKY
jgi:hypothetical protein